MLEFVVTILLRWTVGGIVDHLPKYNYTNVEKLVAPAVTVSRCDRFGSPYRLLHKTLMLKYPRHSKNAIHTKSCPDTAQASYDKLHI